MRPSRRRLAAALALVASAGMALLLATAAALEPVPTSLAPRSEERPRLLARGGEPLTVSYEAGFNVHDTVAYHQIPLLLRQAFITAEDRRFFAHHGVDWPARAHALVDNLLHLGPVRGASTITEQVVRILHPRRRTLWSKWVEGWEARRLERRFTKAEILGFYLNQVPYARRRRGVAQAARTYFHRDLATLSPLEMLTLAVLVRSPSRLDPQRDAEAARSRVLQLADRMVADGSLDAEERRELEGEQLRIDAAAPAVEVAHFVRYVRSLEADGDAQGAAEEPPAVAVAPRRSTASPAVPRRPVVTTTLDLSLQARAQEILDRRLAELADRAVGDGAVLVVDHRSDEILAWVDGGGFASARDGAQIDKVLTPRQPGSALKPFLYALALERGFTAATLIDDAPIADAVGHGLHSFHNYSRAYYGPVRLREALGNSLNTPAVRTARAVGAGDFLALLRRLGFASLDQHPDFYGDGLALGNGEVSLYELVRAYAALARGGELRPLRSRLYDGEAVIDERAAGAALDGARQVLEQEVAAILGHILSDPLARQREFGEGSVLNLPVQTAVKTGTSNDFRDAWAVGYSSRYTVGVWMGNVDRRPMRDVSGSVGPALVLRSIFHELRRDAVTQPLPFSRHLVRRTICADSGQLAGDRCPAVDEWFRPGHAPTARCPVHDAEPTPRLAGTSEPRIESPTPGLHLAVDPRIPDELEAFPFELAGADGARRIDWWLDDRLVASTAEPRYPWPLERGHHRLQARVWLADGSAPVATQTVGFLVK